MAPAGPRKPTHDAEAVAEAAQRPGMRTVAVKSAERQARSMPFHARALSAGRRTQLVNALRGHLSEHGILAGRGVGNAAGPAAPPERAKVPAPVREPSGRPLARSRRIGAEISTLDRWIAAAAKAREDMRHLQTAPGIGPICAMAIATFAPDMAAFRSGRDVAAWPGPVPRQLSRGGRRKRGRTSGMGRRDIRRRLIAGATSVARRRGRDGGRPGARPAGTSARKPRRLVAVALADRMARMVRAMRAGDEDRRDPTGAVRRANREERRRCEEDGDRHERPIG